MVVIYHRNTPLPKVRKGLDAYTISREAFDGWEQRPTQTTHTTRGAEMMHNLTINSHPDFQFFARPFISKFEQAS
jgi:hypothetical protein